MAVKRCTNCNREMGYGAPSKECAPCELGFTKERKLKLCPPVKTKTQP